MCFFFSLASLDINPSPTLKAHAINLALGSFYRAEINCQCSDNSDDSSTSVFSSIIFQKWPKILFLGFSRKPEVIVSSAQNAFGNTWSRIICSKKVQILQGCVINRAKVYLLILTPNL